MAHSSISSKSETVVLTEKHCVNGMLRILQHLCVVRRLRLDLRVNAVEVHGVHSRRQLGKL